MKKILIAMLIVLGLSGCSALGGDDTEVLDSIGEVKDVVDDVLKEVTKEQEVITETVTETITIQEFDVCKVSNSNITYSNVTIKKVLLSDLVTLEYDGAFGRSTEQVDTSVVQIACTKEYK